MLRRGRKKESIKSPPILEVGINIHHNNCFHSFRRPRLTGTRENSSQLLKLILSCLTPHYWKLMFNILKYIFTVYFFLKVGSLLSLRLLLPSHNAMHIASSLNSIKGAALSVRPSHLFNNSSSSCNILSLIYTITECQKFHIWLLGL